MTQNEQKKAAARSALAYVPNKGVIGVGSGTTVGYFIEELASIGQKIEGAVASSEATARRLEHFGIPVLDLNDIEELQIYIDGADEITKDLYMLKGGGGALTREKIIAASSNKFICIADSSKLVSVLGASPLPIEVIPMARSHVSRELLKLGGRAVPRKNFITDNGNIILDVHGLKLSNPVEMEQRINQIVGIVTNGLFSVRPANLLLLATDDGIREMVRPQYAVLAP